MEFREELLYEYLDSVALDAKPRIFVNSHSYYSPSLCQVSMVSPSCLGAQAARLWDSLLGAQGLRDSTYLVVSKAIQSVEVSRFQLKSSGLEKQICRSGGKRILHECLIKTLQPTRVSGNSSNRPSDSKQGFMEAG